jgi:hypothetical protein
MLSAAEIHTRRREWAPADAGDLGANVRRAFAKELAIESLGELSVEVSAVHVLPKYNTLRLSYPRARQPFTIAGSRAILDCQRSPGLGRRVFPGIA